jgi:nucleoside-diphosphate-sugar epimerase
MELKSRLKGFDRVFPGHPSSMAFQKGDLAKTDDLEQLQTDRGSKVFHLAAEAEVVIPFGRLNQFVESNVSGTINLLRTLNPDTVFFASSSAVYGHKNTTGTETGWEFINPVGIYGMSKAMAELVCQQWAVEQKKSAVAFRFGNVIGPRCRGFIPFLVNHAIAHPDGNVAAQCRGGGTIVRDYLPVQYLVDVLIRSLEMQWKPGSFEVFNMGTGRGMTNGDVARIVQSVLKSEGLKLDINWENPISADESHAIILDPQETEDHFELPVPDHDAVVAAIEESTRYFLEQGTATTFPNSPAE